MAVTITNTEHMGVGAFFEIRMQNKSILILLSWVAWHITNSSSECIFSNDVVFDLLWLLRDDRDVLNRLGRRLQRLLFIWVRLLLSDHNNIIRSIWERSLLLR